jgi:hypothetical protein
MKTMKIYTSLLIFLIIIVFSDKTLAFPYGEFNKCELLVAQEDYDKALKEYISLFQKNKNYFLIDIHNALICAVITDNQKEIKYLSKLLSQKGVPEKYFLERSNFSQFRDEKFWKQTAKQSQKKYEANLKKYEQSKRIIDSVFKYDQDTIMMVRKWKDEPELLEYYDNLIRNNAVFLCNYFDSTYFPGDDIVVPYILNDTSFTYIPQDFGAVIIHSYQPHFLIGDTLFNKVLSRALTENAIKPQTLAYIQDMGRTNMHYRPYYGTTMMFSVYNGELYVSEYYFYDRKAREKIDNNRMAIDLLPLEDAVKIIKYSISKGKSLGFILDARITLFPDQNKIPSGFKKLK